MTATQIGLGKVENFATATVEETVVGAATDLFTTPAGVFAAITKRLGETESASLLCGAFISKDQATGSAGWIEFGGVTSTQSGAGVFMIHGVTYNGEPVVVTADYDSTWKLRVQNENGGLLQARFGYVVDVDASRLKLFINPTVDTLDIQVSRISPSGKLIGQYISNWVQTEPEGIVYGVEESSLLKLQRVVMAQGYELAVGLTKAADVVAQVVATAINEFSLSAVVPTVDAGVSTVNWTDSFTTPATPASRLVLGGFMAWEGTSVKIVVNGTTTIDTVLTEGSEYYYTYDLPAGATANVELTVSYPTSVRPADFSSGFVRAEKLDPA